MSKQLRVLAIIDASGYDPRNHVGSRLSKEQRRRDSPAPVPVRAAGQDRDDRGGGHAVDANVWGPRRRSQ